MSEAQSKAAIEWLKGSGGQTNLFDQHLAVEAAIVGSPLSTGNDVRLLLDGPASYQAMVAVTKAPKDPINTKTYILDDDEGHQRFAVVLLAKQAQGVPVNLIRDSVGTVATPSPFFKHLAASEIRVLEFNPTNPVAISTWAKPRATTRPATSIRLPSLIFPVGLSRV